MARLICPAMRCTALRLVWRKRQRPVAETTLALGRDRLLCGEVYQAAWRLLFLSGIDRHVGPLSALWGVHDNYCLWTRSHNAGWVYLRWSGSMLKHRHVSWLVVELWPILPRELAWSLFKLLAFRRVISLAIWIAKALASSTLAARISLFFGRSFLFTARCICISAVYVGMRCLSVCSSVRLSRSWVASKRIKISSKFFHHRVATPF